jgi:hypothetical protein
VLFGNAADLCYASKNPSAFVFGVTDKTSRLNSGSAKQGPVCYLVGQQQDVVCVARSRLGVSGVGRTKNESSVPGYSVRDGFRQPGSLSCVDRPGRSRSSASCGPGRWRNVIGNPQRSRCARFLPGGAVRQTGSQETVNGKSGMEASEKTN